MCSCHSQGGLAEQRLKQEHGLHPIGDAQSAEDRGEMRLHRGLADRKIIGDLLVRASVHQCEQNAALRLG